MNGIWPFSGHPKNDQSRLFWNIPWQAAKKGQWKLSGKQKNSIQIPFTHEFVYFFSAVYFSFSVFAKIWFVKKIELKTSAPATKFEIQLLGCLWGSPKTMKPSTVARRPLWSWGTPLTLGWNFNSAKNLCLQVHQPFPCKSKSTSPSPASPSLPTSPASPPPSRRARWYFLMEFVWNLFKTMSFSIGRTQHQP